MQDTGANILIGNSLIITKIITKLKINAYHLKIMSERMQWPVAFLRHLSRIILLYI